MKGGWDKRDATDGPALEEEMCSQCLKDMRHSKWLWRAGCYGEVGSGKCSECSVIGRKCSWKGISRGGGEVRRGDERERGKEIGRAEMLRAIALAVRGDASGPALDASEMICVF